MRAIKIAVSITGVLQGISPNAMKKIGLTISTENLISLDCVRSIGLGNGWPDISAALGLREAPRNIPDHSHGYYRQYHGTGKNNFKRS